MEKKIPYYNHDEDITIPEYNKFTAETFDFRLK